MPRLLSTLLLLCLAATGLSQKVVWETGPKPVSAYELMIHARPAVLHSLPDNEYIVGLYSQSGKELLGRHYYNIGGYDTGAPLRDNILYFLDTARDRCQRAGFTVLPGYTIKPGAYTRSGLLLYEPFWFDNGPDYFEEGRQRFVYDNKMGFVDRLGEVRVQARYPFVSPYRHGYAAACLDCVYRVIDSADKEHGTSFTGDKWVVIDKSGRELGNVYNGQSINTDSPGPRILLTLKERALAAIILKHPLVLRELKSFGTSPDSLVPVCYDKPSAHSPFYHISFELEGDALSGGSYQFLISPDGEKLFHLTYNLQHAQTMKEWKTELDNMSIE